MKKSIAKRPIFMVALINVLAFALLFIYRTPLNYQTLYVGGSILALNLVTYTIIRYYRLGDEYLFLIVSMLITIGVVMICRINHSLALPGGLVFNRYLRVCIWSLRIQVYRLWEGCGGFILPCHRSFIATQIIGTTINGAKTDSIGGIAFKPPK